MRVAVLIDAENIGSAAAAEILAEAARHGTVSIKRAYGDFSSPHLSSWRKQLAPLAIQPVLQLPNTVGKNAADSALIIDAMDLLHTADTSTFCLVSSDSDFTRLATRLREGGKTVIGIGRSHTPESFRNACDKFTFVEVLTRTSESSGVPTPAPSASRATSTTPATPTTPPEQPTTAFRLPPIDPLVLKAVDASAKDDGWASLSAVGSYLVNTQSSFDPRLYGFARLGDLLRTRNVLVVDTLPGSSSPTVLGVRRAKPKNPVTQAKRTAQKTAATKRAKKAAKATKKATPQVTKKPVKKATQAPSGKPAGSERAPT